MALFTFWRGDEHAKAKSTEDISIQKDLDAATLASLMNQDEENVMRRLQEGSEAWVVRLNNKPVSFG
jgi:hypothetical protein